MSASVLRKGVGGGGVVMVRDWDGWACGHAREDGEADTHFGRRSRNAASHVVDEHVELPAKMLDRRRDGALHVRAICAVGNDGERLGGATALRDDLVEGVLAACDERDTRTARHRELGEHRADARRRSGDEDDRVLLHRDRSSEGSGSRWRTCPPLALWFRGV